MISVTKVLRFEAAHAIYRYPGGCSRIHGHSYELHVTIEPMKGVPGYIGGLGIIYDFKELKAMVNEEVIKLLDHRLILSRQYLQANKGVLSPDEVVVFDVEPTAENLLVFIHEKVAGCLPGSVKLKSLRLWETKDSYAEWEQ